MRDFCDFLEKWFLPANIAILTSYFVALLHFGPMAIPVAVLISSATSLLVLATLLSLRKRNGAKLAIEPGYELAPACHPKASSVSAPRECTPHYICNLYNRFSDKDADTIVAQHKNRLMTVSGKVVFIDGRYVYLDKTSLWYTDGGVRVHFDLGKPDHVTALLLGKRIKVRGQLTSAWERDITLMEAELLKVSWF
jgi:hypothetical protein